MEQTLGSWLVTLEEDLHKAAVGRVGCFRQLLLSHTSAASICEVCHTENQQSFIDFYSTIDLHMLLWKPLHFNQFKEDTCISNKETMCY